MSTKLAAGLVQENDVKLKNLKKRLSLKVKKMLPSSAHLDEHMVKVTVWDIKSLSLMPTRRGANLSVTQDTDQSERLHSLVMSPLENMILNFKDVAGSIPLSNTPLSKRSLLMVTFGLLASVVMLNARIGIREEVSLNASKDTGSIRINVRNIRLAPNPIIHHTVPTLVFTNMNGSLLILDMDLIMAIATLTVENAEPETIPKVSMTDLEPTFGRVTKQLTPVSYDLSNLTPKMLVMSFKKVTDGLTSNTRK